jgi:hypothetical protein
MSNEATPTPPPEPARALTYFERHGSTRLWFGGDDWNAPFLENYTHIVTPVGEVCGMCRNAIEEGDYGIVQPVLGGLRGDSILFAHDDCWTYSVAGPTWCRAWRTTADDTPEHTRYHELRDGGMRPRDAERQVNEELRTGKLRTPARTAASTYLNEIDTEIGAGVSVTVLPSTANDSAGSENE